MMGHAVISNDELYRYRLDREIDDLLPDCTSVFAYFGVNPSTADANLDDQTVRKWSGFTRLNGGCRYIVGNAFAFRSTDVNGLANTHDPIGPENDAYIVQIIGEADILVPCWGSRIKLPPKLRPRFEIVMQMLERSGKPVKTFGYTKSGDPKHPLMLGYDTKLVGAP